MQYEDINKIAELETEIRELKGERNIYKQGLQRIKMGDDVVSSEIAHNALVMGVR